MSNGNTGIMLAQDEYEGPGGEIMRSTPQVSKSALVDLTTAEINSQIAFAQSRPRSVKQFMNVAKDLACLTEEVARSCIYALPRGNKPIEGPSVRLAEIVAYAWGNLRISSRIVSEGDKFLTAQTIVMDLERNTGISIEVQRRCTYKSGKKFDDDMMVVTGNAAISISFRNAIWKIVPAAFVTPIYREARKQAAGERKSIEERRKGVLDWLKLLNVKPEELYALLAIKGIEEVSTDHMILLAGFKTALEDGETSVDQIFRSNGAVTQPVDGAAGLPAPDTKMAKMTQELAQQAQKVKGQPVVEAVVTVSPQPKTVAPVATFAPEVKKQAPVPSVSEIVKEVIGADHPTALPVVAEIIGEAPFDSTGNKEPIADDTFEGTEDFPAKKTEVKPMASTMPAVSGAPWTPKQKKGKAAPAPAKEMFTEEDRGGWTEKSGV